MAVVPDVADAAVTVSVANGVLVATIAGVSVATVVVDVALALVAVGDSAAVLPHAASSEASNTTTPTLSGLTIDFFIYNPLLKTARVWHESKTITLCPDARSPQRQTPKQVGLKITLEDEIIVSADRRKP